MKTIIILSMLATSAYAKIDCNKHPIYCQIKKNKPKMKHETAMDLSNKIYNVSHRKNIPARVYTAILMQESGYSIAAKNCHIGIVPETGKQGKVCTDFGMSQIWYKTAKAFKFDIDKLTEDTEYSIEAGAIVLADLKKRYEDRDIDWWVRYNCGTRSTTKRKTCQIYKQLVERYL